MIISREYVTFRHLVSSGDEAGKIFIEKLHESYDKSMWEHVWETLADHCLYQRVMEWAFCKIGDVIDEFERLDKETPFDNGFTYDDVNDTEIVWKDENSVVIHLVSRIEGCSSIVKVVTVEG